MGSRVYYNLYNAAYQCIDLVYFDGDSSPHFVTTTQFNSMQHKFRVIYVYDATALPLEVLMAVNKKKFRDMKVHLWVKNAILNEFIYFF
jgi:hypothetical protein